MVPLIELKGVTKVYAAPGRGSKAPAVSALQGIDLAVAAGEFTALAGPSGSGKSTLLNIIGTLDTATSGSVAYDGRQVSGLSQAELADFRLRSLGFVFQAFNLIPVLTAAENVEYVLALQGVAKEERRERARKALSQVGLDAEADRRPDLLSGGQQQRVAVARSIVHRPMVVLADEPTANLDSKTAESLLEIMGGLNKDHGVTFLFSSHDPRVLARARRVVHMTDGRLSAV